jgi:mannosyltransferase OCH1-like enzyme
MNRRILFIVIIAICILAVGAGFYHIYSVPHHIPRKDLSAPKSINGVPLAIYQSWHSHIVPKGMKDNILNTVEANPEFDYYLYSDSESRAFIQANYGPDVVAAFDSLRPGAYKSDLWRYCILYKLGGLYFDIKMVPLVPLKSILRDNSTIFVKDLTVAPNGAVMRECVWNGLMISPPKNEVFKHCIDEIVDNCKERLYKRNPLDITGPCLLGRMLKLHSGQEFFNQMVFNLSKENNTTSVLFYHNIPYFLVEYPGYRREQWMFQKSKHYSTLYQNKQVYA